MLEISARADLSQTLTGDFFVLAAPATVWMNAVGICSLGAEKDQRAAKTSGTFKSVPDLIGKRGPSGL